MPRPRVLFATEQKFAPFGQISLASSLKAKGIDADIVVDAAVGSHLLGKALSEQPEFIGFSVYDYTAPGMDLFIEKLRKASPSSYIAIGGPLPSADLEGSVLVTTADFAIGGAGEIVFPEVVDILKDTKRGDPLDASVESELKEVTSFFGIFNGKEVMGKKGRNSVGDILDNLPLDLTLLTPLEKTGGIPLVTSRGCGYLTCNFCAAPAISGRWKGMSAERIMEILKELSLKIERGEVHKVYQTIVLQDDDFLFDRERFLKFAEMFKSSGLNGKLKLRTAQTSIDTLFVDHDPNKEIDTEVIDAAKSLFYALLIGTDGFTDTELKRLGKDRYKMRHVEQVAKALVAEEFHQVHYAILTNYETNIQDLMKSCFNIASMAIRYPNLLVDANTGVQAFIGTKVHEDMRSSIAKGEQHDTAMHHAVQSPYFNGEPRESILLRSAKGYREFTETGETRYPVFIPHVDAKDKLTQGFVQLLSRICRDFGAEGLDDRAIGLSLVIASKLNPGMPNPRGMQSIELAQNYVHRLNTLASEYARNLKR